jgi:hypothetical protein
VHNSLLRCLILHRTWFPRRNGDLALELLEVGVMPVVLVFVPRMHVAASGSLAVIEVGALDTLALRRTRQLAVAAGFAVVARVAPVVLAAVTARNNTGRCLILCRVAGGDGGLDGGLLAG